MSADATAVQAVFHEVSMTFAALYDVEMHAIPHKIRKKPMRMVMSLPILAFRLAIAVFNPDFPGLLPHSGPRQLLSSRLTTQNRLAVPGPSGSPTFSASEPPAPQIC
mmetsp:Transcript_41692/g.65070  ORF Transcript_41692/g.65070 Transcript_41692/m.65070 type:complete len:107 (+) Transcript_41692:1000-1320(+)